MYDETTPVIPIVFAISVVRSGSATRTTSFAVRWSGENAAAAIAFAVAGMSSCRPGAEGLITILPVAVTWNRASCGLRASVAERRSRYFSASRPPIETLGAPAGGQREQRCDPPARHAPARLAVGEADRGGESGAGANCRVGEVVAADAGLGRRERKRHRQPAIEARESADDDRGRCSPVELTARAALDDAHGEPSPHEPRIDALPIDRASDLSRACSHGRVVGLDRWGDVDAEEPRPQALEAADRPEAATLGRGRRSLPVGRDAELRGRERELPTGAVKMTGVRSSAAAALPRASAPPRPRTGRRRRPRPPSSRPEASSATRRTRARRDPRAARRQPSGKRPGAGQSGGGIGSGARGGGRSSCRCAPKR